MLIHYLVLAVAIAPSICCCNSTALLGQVVMAIAPNSSDASSSAGMPQCPFHAGSGASQNPAPNDIDSSSHEEGIPAEDHCPCHKLKRAMALASVKSSVELAKFIELCDLICCPTATVEILSNTAANTDFFNHAASPIGRDILRAYQHFRC